MTIQEEMKQKMLDLRSNLLERLSKIQDHRKRGMDGAQNSDDMSQVESNDIVIEKLAVHEENTLKKINAALSRMDNNSYGQCTSCDDQIRENRLRALPYTLLCEECAEDQENNK